MDTIIQLTIIIFLLSASAAILMGMAILAREFFQQTHTAKSKKKLEQSVLPWPVVWDNVDWQEAHWCHYVLDTVRTIHGFREHQTVTILLAAYNTARQADMDLDTLAYTEAVLTDYVAGIWPDAGL